MTIVEIEQLVLELQERITVLENKPKRSKKKNKVSFERSLSVDGYIALILPPAKKTIERKLSVECKVGLHEVIEKAQMDESFMGNFQEWKQGDDQARPTLYFLDGYGLNAVKFGKAGDFAKKFKKG